MPRSEIVATWFTDCLDTKGNRIRVGYGATRSGRVVLLYPSGHTPVLNQQQALDVQEKLRQAIITATVQDG